MRKGDWGPGKVFLDSESVGTGRKITGKSNQRNPAACSKSHPAVRNLDWGLKSGGAHLSLLWKPPTLVALLPTSFHSLPFAPPSLCITIISKEQI